MYLYVLFILYFDYCKSRVVVDALVVHGPNLEPLDTGVDFELGRRVADDIFHENRIVVSLHGNMALIGAFEQWIDRGGGRFFCHIHEFLDPEEIPGTIFLLTRADGDGDISALIVGSVVADFLGAGAEGANGNAHTEEEVVALAIGFPDECAEVVHGRGETGDRGLALDKVGKLDFDVCRLGIEAFFQVVKDCRDCAHGELALVLSEDLQEARHVGAFEVMWQTHGEGNLRSALLLLVLPVEDSDWVKQIADTNLVYRDSACVWSALDVFHFSYSAHDELVSQTLTRTSRTVSRCA